MRPSTRDYNNFLKAILVIPLLIVCIRVAGENYHPVNTDTILINIKELHLYPCEKGKNTLEISAVNNSKEELIFAVHIQSNISLNASVGRGWGTVFYDSLPPGVDIIIEHSFPFYADVNNDISLRIQFYQLKMSEKWDFNNHFYSKTFKSNEITDLCLPKRSNILTENVNIIEEFRRIQNLLRNESYKDIWHQFTKSYQEAQYQSDFSSFEGKMHRPQPIDNWNAEQLLCLIPRESFQLEDGRIKLNLTLNSNPWSIYFRYNDDQWKIDWIDGFATLVELWMTWPDRILPKMELVSTEHFDFYFEKESYAEKTIQDITRTREAGYQKICDYLEQDSHQRITTVLFNDIGTKAFETGHRGKGAAFDTTVIEVYNEEIRANPYHETVHILTNRFGFPPAIFIEGFAEYMEIVLAGENSMELIKILEKQIKELIQEDEWIPIKELIAFRDIPGPSPAHISYPEAAAFVKFLIEKYDKHRFFKVYKSLTNSSDELIILDNIEKLELIYDLPFDNLVNEFRKVYLP